MLREQTCALLPALVAIVGLFAPVGATAQQADDERLFRQRCGACHSMDPGQSRAGPHLSGVIGRTAGSIERARYSDAMRDSTIVWNGESLDTFLAAPRQMVPGTTWRLPSPMQLSAAIIAYLGSNNPMTE